MDTTSIELGHTSNYCRYVVAKASWKDARMWAATMLMFLSGCFKYAERTLCLYLASPRWLRSESLGVMSRVLPSLLIEGERGILFGFSKLRDLEKKKHTKKENEVESFFDLRWEGRLLGGGRGNPNGVMAGGIISDIMSIDAPRNRIPYVIPFNPWIGLSETTYTSITKDHTPIKKFILDYLLDFGKAERWDITSSRGQQAICCRSSRSQNLWPALLKATGKSVDFPTSVLIWHIATDMCYYCGHNTNTNFDQIKMYKQMSRELSNYITYLVYKCNVTLTSESQILR